MNWKNSKVSVMGSTPFMGSHVVDVLLGRPEKAYVVDNLSGGRLDTVEYHVELGKVDFIQADLTER